MNIDNLENIKYYSFLFFVAVNAVFFSPGDHYAPFVSTSLMCLISVYYSHKTDKILARSRLCELDLANELAKVGSALDKMSGEEQAKFRRILKSL